ncbi:acyl-CoA dehydrogenase family protein [Advenella sp. FME57]|uniref:acyl-CoA dehydrogenase family protein n=1 Tax=Advenella sp. FME57 TaxID=2742604 RepID=UPI001867793A|nr:acyl-CoA dehydrogenase family protein [Advenella sp. FME57]
MGFEAATIFPGVLLEGAERVAKKVSSYEAAIPPGIIQEMGWSSTLISESNGGYGGTFADIGSLLEGMASRAVNLPIMTRCCIVPGMLEAAPEQETVSTLLSQIAQGVACIELAGSLSCRETHKLAQLSPVTDGCWILSGQLDAFEWTECCTHVLFCALDTASQKISIVLIEVEQLPDQSRRFTTVERRCIKQVDLGSLKIANHSVLAQGDAALAMRQAGWKLAQVSVAADIVCTMNYMLAETVSYLQERKQFGQALAQFQVLRHDVAKLYVSFETGKNLLIASLRSLDGAGGSDDLAALDLLGIYTREQAIAFAQSVIQLHGGMGMTQETMAARMASRLLASAFRFGDAYSHAKALTQFQAGTK